MTLLHHDLADLRRQVALDTGQADETSAMLDDLEDRLSALTGESSKSPEAVILTRQQSAHELPIGRSWEQTRTDAADLLRHRGLDPNDADLDKLLDPAEIARIERRALGAVEIRSRLDQYDLMFAAAAGIAATLVDSLLVGIPRNVRWHDEQRRGSWLTGWLRDHAIDSDNWLAKIAKVPFDSMYEGMSGRTHRVQTFGHDPLLGLVLGTIDIMRGTATGVTPTGGVFVHDTNFAPVPNPLAALTREILHLLSDMPTRAGLPVPGWSVLMTLQTGDIDGKRIDEWAKLMYVRGYDTWHFLSMSTVPATVHTLVRAYWGLRQALDEDYSEQVGLEAGPTGDTASGHPRFDSLLLAAHSVAAAGNIAKVVAYGGNPLAINYNQWLAFFNASFNRLRNPGPTLTERLGTQSFHNSAVLQDGWVELAKEASLPDWPVG